MRSYVSTLNQYAVAISRTPCHMAKHIVTAGLKWPPEVGAQVIIANAIPRA